MSAPTWRPDLNEPCDLVEEVARLVGYDEIPVTVPPAPVKGAVGLTPDQRRQRWVADTLAEYGMVESLSYPFVGDEDFKAFSYDPAVIKPVSVEIANPLAGDRPYLRRDVLPTLATTVQRNLRRGLEDIRLYEIGHVYLWDPNAPAIPALPGGVRPSDEQLAALDAGLPDQPLHVAGLLTATRSTPDGSAIVAPSIGATPSRPFAVSATVWVRVTSCGSPPRRMCPRSGTPAALRRSSRANRSSAWSESCTRVSTRRWDCRRTPRRRAEPYRAVRHA